MHPKYVFWTLQQKFAFSAGNHLHRLLKKFPNKRWNQFDLSKNPNITLEYILKHPEIPWDWRYVSMNPNISMQDIKNNPQLPWVWSVIGQSRCIFPEDLFEVCKSEPEKLNWHHVCRNYYLTFEDILKFMDIFLLRSQETGGNVVYTIKNPEHEDEIGVDVWVKRTNLNWVSFLNSITLQTVLDNPQFPWDWMGLSWNTNVATWENVRNNPERNWSITELSANKNITWDIIEKNPVFTTFVSTSSNYEPTASTSSNYGAKQSNSVHWGWDYYHMSLNTNITPDIVKKTPILPWNPHYLCENPNFLPWKYPIRVLNRPSATNNAFDENGVLSFHPLVHLRFSSNPNATYKLILDTEIEATSTVFEHGKISWYWPYVSMNTFTFNLCVYNKLTEKVRRKRMRLTRSEFVNWY